MDNTLKSAKESRVQFLLLFWESSFSALHLQPTFRCLLNIFSCLLWKGWDSWYLRVSWYLGQSHKRKKNEWPNPWAVLTSESLLLRCSFKMWVHIVCRTEMRTSEPISFLSNEYKSTTATTSEMQMHSGSPEELWEMPTHISVRHLLTQTPGVASRSTSLLPNDSDCTFQWCIGC